MHCSDLNNGVISGHSGCGPLVTSHCAGVSLAEAWVPEIRICRNHPQCQALAGRPRGTAVVRRRHGRARRPVPPSQRPPASGQARRRTRASHRRSGRRGVTDARSCGEALRAARRGRQAQRRLHQAERPPGGGQITSQAGASSKAAVSHRPSQAATVGHGSASRGRTVCSRSFDAI